MPDTETQKNIKLDYKVRVEIPGHGIVYSSDSCEFFMDEYGYEWIKFIAKNGYNIGKEHMIRTDQIILVRE